MNLTYVYQLCNITKKKFNCVEKIFIFSLPIGTNLFFPVRIFMQVQVPTYYGPTHNMIMINYQVFFNSSSRIRDKNQTRKSESQHLIPKKVYSSILISNRFYSQVYTNKYIIGYLVNVSQNIAIKYMKRNSLQSLGHIH